MSTAVDTNSVVDLLAGDDFPSREPSGRWIRCIGVGAQVMCGVVYAELLAYPDRTDDDVVAVVQAAGIRVDWDLGQSVWRSAGLAYAQYVSRRRQAETVALRRILADFVIGADAAGVGSLLTRDLAIYRASFPELAVWGPGDVTDVARCRTPEGAPSCVRSGRIGPKGSCLGSHRNPVATCAGRRIGAGTGGKPAVSGVFDERPAGA